MIITLIKQFLIQAGIALVKHFIPKWFDAFLGWLKSLFKPSTVASVERFLANYDGAIPLGV